MNAKQYFDKLHRTNFKKVRSSIRRLKIKRTDKKVLIADISLANVDLMHLLATPEGYKDVSDYFDTINAYLRSENDSYDYQVTLYYKIGNMGKLMEIIRQYHNKLDRYNELKEKIFGNETT